MNEWDIDMSSDEDDILADSGDDLSTNPVKPIQPTITATPQV